MSEFKRSPSKVWWGNDHLEWREVSASPGSQDSGFSDTEASPHNQILSDKNDAETPKKGTTARRIPKDIFKELSSDEKPQNLTINFKEKSTPNKTLSSQLHYNRLIKSDSKVIEIKKSPEFLPQTEPVRKHRFTKNSPKVSRSLFNNSKQKESYDGNNQYAEDVLEETTQSRISSEGTFSDSHSWQSEDSFNVLSTQSLPPHFQKLNLSPFKNKTVPAELDRLSDNEAVTSFNHSLSSDCESELECLFNGPLDSPKHTSTPKTDVLPKMRQRVKKIPLDLYLKHQQERVPPILTQGVVVENKAVQKWMDEARFLYEQECMTTLQSKSIAGELNQKVSHLAACATTIIRGILSQSRCIELEYQSLNSERDNVEPLVQSLAGNIMDFIKNHKKEISAKILKHYDNIRKATCNDSLKLVSQLFNVWETIRHEILVKEIKKLVDKLESPNSELDLRATVTGITSISLRNEELVELFCKADIIPILLILCEKCEGSSMRALLLRALSTMCINTLAIRQFEKFSGVQIIADTIEEDSRPEPERSEAIALLAQITAPWIEDNHCVKGLQEYSRKLVKHLTVFLSKTICCQNLLLCAAALANLSTMDSKCIKFMLHINTAKILLDAVRNRGPRTSVYLLEQVATLIANMSAMESSRKQLTEIKVPAALLCFLTTSSLGEDVEKRLQQKSMIALSRLCGDKEAATQIVDMGGVEKLVKMCREKNERYDSDAVLVAALATLRKLADTCGSDVISAQDAQELVEPKLLDSFLAYSTQNESYV